jgi:hypothetical protein
VLLEWSLIALAVALGVRALGAPRRHSLALLGAQLAAGWTFGLGVASSRQPPAPQPIALGVEGFATSNSCRSCHPSEYASWHASYHRRMTQSASRLSVAAETLRQGGRLRVESTGRTVEIFSREHELWASLPDPALTSAAPPEAYESAFRAAPSRDVRIELLTGSHHHQGFWVKGARQGELRSLPAVYSIDEQRLLPRRDAFLNPPEAPEQAVRWNSNCVQCHSVAGAPAHDLGSDGFATSAAELGIACEACHGGGQAHVRAMQNPLARYRAQDARTATGITNPQELASERASQVCGRCHSYFFPRSEADWWEHGFARSYAPGDDLSKAQLLLSPQLLATPGAPQLGASADSLFYADGTIRIGGREYNGLTRSPCYERGAGKRKLSCLSCHSMHQGAPDDQLAPEKLGNSACAGCHEREGQNVAAHSHHAATSPGSLCYNCHMPHTSYALLGAIRSHQVDSPAFDARTQDRPNACNLCHLEQTEAWAARQSAAWYGSEPRFVLSRPDSQVPAGASFALRGDAAVRAITAAALGRHESSHDAPALRRQLLGELAHDDYAAVRFIAERAARTQRQTLDPPPLTARTVEELLAARDRRPVTIAE